jgi:hypothetical protein
MHDYVKSQICLGNLIVKPQSYGYKVRNVYTFIYIYDWERFSILVRPQLSGPLLMSVSKPRSETQFSVTVLPGADAPRSTHWMAQAIQVLCHFGVVGFSPEKPRSTHWRLEYMQYRYFEYPIVYTSRSITMVFQWEKLQDASLFFAAIVCELWMDTLDLVKTHLGTSHFVILILLCVIPR